jgi:hypothetical protein
MQQGLTSTFKDDFLEKLSLKINVRKYTLKVTYQELIEVKTTRSQAMPAW